jgi:hypothetical protein
VALYVEVVRDAPWQKPRGIQMGKKGMVVVAHVVVGGPTWWEWAAGWVAFAVCFGIVAKGVVW